MTPKEREIHDAGVELARCLRGAWPSTSINVPHDPTVQHVPHVELRKAEIRLIEAVYGKQG